MMLWCMQDCSHGALKLTVAPGNHPQRHMQARNCMQDAIQVWEGGSYTTSNLEQ